MKLDLNHLLSKAKEYGLPLKEDEQSNVYAIHDIITLHEWEQNELFKRADMMFSNSTVETWEEESIIRAQKAIERLYQRVQNNPVLSTWQTGILDKANQYGLKYNLDNMDWFKLSDTIDEIEPLISVAESYGIFDWDANDIVDLRQKIEEAQHNTTKDRMILRNEYLSSIL